MTKNFFFALMASTLLAAPAMAQSSGSQSGSQSASGQSGCAALHASMQGQSGSSGSQQQSGSSGQSGTASASLTSANEVEQKLKDSGLSDVQVFDASYFVEATAPNNECVIMMIDTSTMAAMQQQGSSGSSSQQGSSASSSSSASASGSSGSGSSGAKNAKSAKDESSKNVIETLKQAGYSDVRVLDATYAASASLEGGEPVMMVVGAQSAMQQQSKTK